MTKLNSKKTIETFVVFIVSNYICTPFWSFMKIRVLFISIVLLVITDINSQTFKLNIEIENIEYKVNNEKKLNDLMENSRIDQETKNIERINVKNNLGYLKEIVKLLEEENTLVVQKKKLELQLQKELTSLDNPQPISHNKIPPPPVIQNKTAIPTERKSSEQKQDKNDIPPPRKSMSIEGDLRSALQNKFKNAGTGFDSD